MPSSVRIRYPIALMTAAVLGWTPAALADSSDSSNWAGYAVHRSNLSFKRVEALWRQPEASCTPGDQSYSAYWVGLGGYNRSSDALEQIGTELDCSLSGDAISSAWYELVPAPSEPLSLAVRPGDVLEATVIVSGHRVTLELSDLTRHRSYKKTVIASAVDTSSAEWIVEAPSECVSLFACQTLPLANFGSATFAFALAQSSSGHLGSISNRAWQSTKINLTPGGRRFIAYRGDGPAVGAAIPSSLQSNGSSFRVTYSQMPLEGNPVFSLRRGSDRPGYLVHPAR